MNANKDAGYLPAPSHRKTTNHGEHGVARGCYSNMAVFPVLPVFPMVKRYCFLS